MRPRARSAGGVGALTGAMALWMLSGCGAVDSDTTTSTSLESATLSLVASADPVVALPSPDSDYEWLAAFTVGVTEGAGVAGTIQSVQAALSEASGGIIVIGTGDEDAQVNVSSATNSLPAEGTVTLTFNVYYTLPGGGREAVVDIVVQVLDDNGYTVQEALRVNVS